MKKMRTAKPPLPPLLSRPPKNKSSGDLNGGPRKKARLDCTVISETSTIHVSTGDNSDVMSSDNETMRSSLNLDGSSVPSESSIVNDSNMDSLLADSTTNSANDADLSMQPAKSICRQLICCVHGCPVTSRNAKHLKFFRFPSDQKRGYMWAKFTRRKSIRTAADCGQLDESKPLRICSAHFKIVDFTDPFERSKLIGSAVPSVFDVSSCPWYLIKDYVPSVGTEQPVWPENSSAQDVPLPGDNVLESTKNNSTLASQNLDSLVSPLPHPSASPCSSTSSSLMVMPFGIDYSDLCTYHRLFVRSVTFVGTELEELKFCAKCGSSTLDPIKLSPNVFQIKCHRGHSLLVTNELNQRCHDWLLACQARHLSLGKSDLPCHSPCHLCDDHFVPPHDREPVASSAQTQSEASISTADFSSYSSDAMTYNGTSPNPASLISNRRKFRHAKENGLPQIFPTLVRQAFRFSAPTLMADAFVDCCIDQPSTSDASVQCQVPLRDMTVGCKVTQRNVSLCYRVPSRHASVGCNIDVSDACVGPDDLTDSTFRRYVPQKDVAISCRVPTRSVFVGCHVMTNDAMVGTDRVMTRDAWVSSKVIKNDASVGCNLTTPPSTDLLPFVKGNKNIKKEEVELEQFNGEITTISMPLLISKQRRLIELLKGRLAVVNKTADQLRKQSKELANMNLNESTVIEKVLPSYLKGVSLKLVETQVRLANRKRLSRWPPFILALGKVIDNESMHAYNIVRQLWNFPARQTLRKLPALPHEMLSVKRFIAEYFHGVALIQERPLTGLKNDSTELSMVLQRTPRVQKVPAVEAAMGRMMASDSEDSDADPEDDEEDDDDDDERFLATTEKRAHTSDDHSTADEAAIAADYLLHSEVPFANEEVTATTTSLMEDMPIFMDTETYNELEVQTSLAPATTVISAESGSDGVIEMNTSGLPPQITLENGTMVYEEIAEDGSTVYHHCQILGQFDSAETFQSALLGNVEEVNSKVND